MCDGKENAILHTPGNNIIGIACSIQCACVCSRTRTIHCKLLYNCMVVECETHNSQVNAACRLSCAVLEIVFSSWRWIASSCGWLNRPSLIVGGRFGRLAVFGSLVGACGHWTNLSLPDRREV